MAAFFQKAVKPNTIFSLLAVGCVLSAYSTDTYGFLKTLLVQLMRTGTQDNTRSIQF